MPALASDQDASEARPRERVGTHLRAFRTGDRAMTTLLRWYLRLLAGLTIISCLGQLGLPARLGAASAWGVAPGWQRERRLPETNSTHRRRPSRIRPRRRHRPPPEQGTYQPA